MRAAGFRSFFIGGWGCLAADMLGWARGMLGLARGMIGWHAICSIGMGYDRLARDMLDWHGI